MDPTGHPRMSHRKVLQTLGAIGFLGVISMAFTDVVGILSRPHYDPLRDTISLLAYHRLTGPQDIGLYLMALGTAACGCGLYLWLRAVSWRWVLLDLLLIAAAAMLVLTISDVFTKGDPLALHIHEESTVATGAALLVASALFPFALPKEKRFYRVYSFVTSAGLAVIAALYFVVPSGYVGLYERVLVADGMAWVGMIAFLLVRAGRALKRT